MRIAAVVLAVLIGAPLIAAPSQAAAQETGGLRADGADRYETAALVSEAMDLCAVVVANGRSFPDGLTGAVVGAPILLTETDVLPDKTVAELDRLALACEPSGGIEAIIVMGGTAAVSEAVFTELAGYTAVIGRAGGADRYETALILAAAFAEAWGLTEGTVVLATGADFPDALAAGPLAALRYPIILNDGDGLRADVAEFLAFYEVSNVIILGGRAAVPRSVQDQLGELGITTQRLAGVDRYETAVAIAEDTFVEPLCAMLVNGSAFPDALAAGPFGNLFGCPITLAERDSLPQRTAEYLRKNSASLELLFVIGGTAVISDEVANEAIDAATTPTVASASSLTPADPTTEFLVEVATALG